MQSHVSASSQPDSLFRPTIHAQHNQKKNRIGCGDVFGAVEEMFLVLLQQGFWVQIQIVSVWHVSLTDCFEAFCSSQDTGDTAKKCLCTYCTLQIQYRYIMQQSLLQMETSLKSVNLNFINNSKVHQSESVFISCLSKD